MPKMDKEEFRAIAYKHAKTVESVYGAKPEEMAAYLTAIAEVESTFRIDARNKNSTARGIMQFLICTQRECEKKRVKGEFAPAMFSCKHYVTKTVDESKDRLLIDADYAVMLAAYELGYQFKRYKQNWEKAVHAYNQGSYPGGNLNEGGKYVAKVKKNVGENLSFDYAGLINEPVSSQFAYNDSSITYYEFY